MRKKTLRMARPEYVLRFAKWLNQADDAKLDITKSHAALAEDIYFHLLYK